MWSIVIGIVDVYVAAWEEWRGEGDREEDEVGYGVAA